eukprot:5367489-Prymnesium_polylepis.1
MRGHDRRSLSPSTDATMEASACTSGVKSQSMASLLSAAAPLSSMPAVSTILVWPRPGRRGCSAEMNVAVSLPVYSRRHISRRKRADSLGEFKVTSLVDSEPLTDTVSRGALPVPQYSARTSASVSNSWDSPSP